MAASAAVLAIAVVAVQRRHLVLPHERRNSLEEQDKVAEALADRGAGAIQTPDRVPGQRAPLLTTAVAEPR